MITSIDTGKTFGKFQHLFMTKSPEETRNKKNVPQHIKGYIWQTDSQDYTNLKLEPFLLRQEWDESIYFLHFINTALEFVFFFKF
jgi:hypothetical protein